MKISPKNTFSFQKGRSYAATFAEVKFLTKKINTSTQLEVTVVLGIGLPKPKVNSLCLVCLPWDAVNNNGLHYIVADGPEMEYSHNEIAKKYFSFQKGRSAFYNF